jgi:transposase InsO family protein
VDCFYVGRLSGTKGAVWQYTAIDVASADAWAELHSSERNPCSQHCQRLLHRLGHELALAGWTLKTVTTDNGSEFTNRDFSKAVETIGGQHHRIKAGRLNSNGCVERVQLTILAAGDPAAPDS